MYGVWVRLLEGLLSRLTDSVARQDPDGEL
jgi:hypothetical protein